jgi:hypothetical protein
MSMPPYIAKYRVSGQAVFYQCGCGETEHGFTVR